MMCFEMLDVYKMDDGRWKRESYNIDYSFIISFNLSISALYLFEAR